MADGGQKFIDRGAEIAALGKAYKGPGAAMVVVCGRRRIGKTALLAEFGRGRNMLYFLATEEAEAANIAAFQALAAEFTGNALLVQGTFGAWAPLFEAIAEYEPKRRKLVIIDEFQYLGKTNPAFPSVLQKIWDTTLKKSNVMFVLCGSLVTMMKQQTLDYASPLYGRRMGQLKMRQIPFEHYGGFFPKLGRKEQIEYYSVTGGVPKYVELFRGERSVYSAIRKHVLDTGSFLYEEPFFLLRGEVSEIGSYFSLIHCVANGNRKLADIAAAA